MDYRVVPLAAPWGESQTTLHITQPLHMTARLFVPAADLDDLTVRGAAAGAKKDCVA